VLLELAAANAAFAVIKETLQNGGEIMSAGRAVVDWFNAKNSLQEKVLFADQPRLVCPHHRQTNLLLVKNMTIANRPDVRGTEIWFGAEALIPVHEIRTGLA